jgi:GR25 family glycosyltransferase involved in LPS biosynthesis
MQNNERKRNNIDVVVISLVDSAERRKTVSAQMEKFGVHYKFFDAFNPAKMNPDDLEYYRNIHQPFDGMSTGQFGCSLSHFYNVKNWLDQKDSDFLIVCEDDILLTEKITEILCSQEQLWKLPFDLLKLGGHASTRGRTAVKIGNLVDADIVYPFDPSMNTVAYVLKRSGAEKFLGHVEKFTTTVDPKLFKEVIFGFVVLEVSPFFFHETGSSSTIHPTIEFKNAEPKNKFMLRAKNDFDHFFRTLRNIAHYVLSVRSVGSIVRIK